MTRPLALATFVTTLGLATAAWATPAEVTAPTNLRTGPAVGYPVLTLLAPGTPVNIYGCLDDVDWCDVGYGELRGWMSARFLASARRWYPERPRLNPPVFSPPPIYAEPPVYANPPPIRRPPVYAAPGYGWGPDDPGYIVPPPGFVYRPPAVMPPVEAYPARPLAPRARPAPTPPKVVTAPPALRPSQPATPPSTPAPVAPPKATVPAAPQPTTSASAKPPVTAPATAPTTTPTTPKYGSAVGKPGAPCKWVNGVCRSD